MQRIIVAVIILAAVGTLSAFAVSELSDRADAAPPLQARESEISFIAGAEVQLGGSVLGEFDDSVQIIKIDPAKYPAGTNFKLEVNMRKVLSDPRPTYCFRLAEKGAPSAGVVGSGACTSSSLTQYEYVESGNFTLASGERRYVIQTQPTNPQGASFGAPVFLARVIAEWTERR